jgi:hypothetical protein
MPVDPDVDYRLLEEAAEEAVEHFNEFIDQVWDSGVFIFPRQKPRVRLAFYQQNTLPGDVFLVTDPDYMKLREAGQAPPLFAEIMAQQYQQAQMQFTEQQMAFDAEMQGAEDMVTTLPPDPAMLPPPPPALWVLLLQVPRIFTRAGSDFRALQSAAMDKAMEAV